MYDLIILGGGPAGYRAAELAGHSGMRVLLIEDGRVGGVCLHEGCIPTKTLLHSAHMLQDLAEARRYGLSAAEYSLDHPAVIRRKDKIVRILDSAIRASLKGAGVDLYDGRGAVKGKGPDGFTVETADGVYTGKYLLIATGSEAIVPPIPGLAMCREGGTALTSREALSLTEVPKRLVIIGGGVIGLEMADYFNTAGAQVTVVEMLDHIGGDMDWDMNRSLQSIMQKRGIAFHLKSKATGVCAGSVTCENGDGAFTIECDSVLVCIGRRPLTRGCGLDNIGLDVQTHIPVDEYGRTRVPGVYAAGDVTGACLLAHTAYRQAEVFVHHMLGVEDTMSYRAIPLVVYTHPEYASVGETEQSAREKELPAKMISLSLRYSGRFVVENEGGDGLCKLVVNRKDGTLIGAQCLGNPASEMIFGLALAVENGLTVEQIRRTVFPHPTVSEIFRETAFRLP